MDRIIIHAMDRTVIGRVCIYIHHARGWNINPGLSFFSPRARRPLWPRKFPTVDSLDQIVPCGLCLLFCRFCSPLMDIGLPAILLCVVGVFPRPGPGLSNRIGLCFVCILPCILNLPFKCLDRRILLFVTLPNSNYSKILQIKRRYSIIHSDVLSVRLFYPVPSCVIMT